MNNTKKKIAIAMSGGVDSSVAAALLKEEGFDVIGLTMHLWDYEAVGGNVAHETSCCSVENIYDAQHVCEHLKIPHYTIDLRKEFENYVVKNFITEYLNGRTPNPCILCNSIMKWDVLISRANKLNISLFSTGHYAQIKYDSEINRYLLLKGKDHTKDQSYALWMLTQQQLEITKLPLGKYTKKDVRKLASDFNLKTEKKSESQEICFIPDDNYKRFLTERVPEVIASLKNGEIVDTTGQVLGYHDGYPFYTIGQRRKLGVAVGKPLYVFKIDHENNRIFVGDQVDLENDSLIANDVNWIYHDDVTEPIEVTVKIRYNDSGVPAVIYPITNKRVKIIFNKKARSITPGQSAVFYKDDIVVGGGVISAQVLSQ